MYDTVNMYICLDKAGVCDCSSIYESLCNVGEHTYNGNTTITGELLGLSVSITDTRVKVKDGSLCKFFLGDNYQTLGRKETEQAFEKLSDALHLPMNKAVITRLDVGKNVILKHPTQTYLNHLGELPRYTRLETESGLYYTQKSGNSLCIYDKNKEQATRHKPIPELYQGKNVLRLEQRYTQRASQRLKVTEILGFMLYDRPFYTRLLETWRDTFKAIKAINDITPNFDEMKTKKSLYLFGLLSLVERYGGQSAFLAHIREAQAKGQLTKKQAYDMRQMVITACSNQTNIDTQTDYITELKNKIQLATKFQ